MGIEFVNVARPEVGATQELISHMWEDCSRLLQNYGFPQKEAWLRKTLTHFQGNRIPISSAISLVETVSSKAGTVRVEISANRSVLRESEIVRMKHGKSFSELVLVKTYDLITPLIFENWGMGERLDRLEYTEGHDGEIEIHSTNPRVASSEEVKPYKQALEEILKKRSIN